MGYHRAGFEVVGVDLRPQPHYPFQFHKADALAYPLEGFDFVHASPPCQAFTALAALHPGSPDLLGPIRERLQAWGGPWIIENVPRAPMRADVMLCGSMFGLGVWRHRLFEFAEPVRLPTLGCSHVGSPVGVYGHSGGGRWASRRTQRYPVARWREAMGIDWMTAAELAQAIPPAYTEWLGSTLIRANLL